MFQDCEIVQYLDPVNAKSMVMTEQHSQKLIKTM